MSGWQRREKQKQKQKQASSSLAHTHTHILRCEQTHQSQGNPEKSRAACDRERKITQHATSRVRDESESTNSGAAEKVQMRAKRGGVCVSKVAVRSGAIMRLRRAKRRSYTHRSPQRMHRLLRQRS